MVTTGTGPTDMSTYINEVVNRDLERDAIENYFDRDHVLEILRELGHDLAEDTVEVTPEVASAFDIVAAFMQGNPVRQAGVRFVLP